MLKGALRQTLLHKGRRPPFQPEEPEPACRQTFRIPFSGAVRHIEGQLRILYQFAIRLFQNGLYGHLVLPCRRSERVSDSTTQYQSRHKTIDTIAALSVCFDMAEVVKTLEN